ncbi:hypothetical protein AMJ49_06130 [Parcubacteria bacterium DG_74_2]|nr:MAG: hypothetical protein AMJ49_06130 [Parcubacteria bacterium DG_74_2]
MNGEKQSNRKINHDILKWIVIGLAGFAVVVLIFGTGMFVGGMKAKFSYRWAESYHKNFAGPRGGFLGDWQKMPPFPGDFIEGHGVFGEIIEINLSADSGQAGFVVKGRKDVERIVITTEDTVIKEGRETIKDNLEVGDLVVIIGSPNEEGQIKAKLIRIFKGELKGSPIPFKGHRYPFL